MNYNVPQFVEMEDKIAFRLTAKQLGIFMLGGVVCFFAWMIVDGGILFYIICGIVGLIAVAFSFFMPVGMTLSAFVKRGFSHIFRPRLMLWKMSSKKIEENTAPRKIEKLDSRDYLKREKLKKIDEFAKILDEKGKF